MKLYLVQHAEAEVEEKDPDRPLTEKGRNDVERVALFAAEFGLDVSRIFHSGKTRARQTAEILGRHLRPSSGISQLDGLKPMDDPKVIGSRLVGYREAIALVGHLPHLGKIAGLLLCGDARKAPIGFRNGGIACLEMDDTASWSVGWVITPEILPRE